MKKNKNIGASRLQYLRESLKCLRFVLIFVSLALLNLNVNALQASQQFIVSGKVTDAADGTTMAGVSIAVKGTTMGCISDENGLYTLNVSDATATLVFSFIGYQTREIPINGMSVVNAALTSEVTDLSEVVVIGYGTQKKVSLTGAVAAVQGEDLLNRKVSVVTQALQGEIPGLTILDLGAAPGKTNMTLRVRGLTTLSNSDPLIIVDGLEQSIDFINPEDIESISVLKDAASTAIYGSRAANGVILVTTKRAKSSKLAISYSGYYALQKSNNNPQHMGVRDYMELQNTAWINSAGYPIYTDEYIEEYVAGTKTDPLRYPMPNTWYDVVLHTAPQLNNNLSISGGNESIKSMLSVRSFDQDGIIPNSNSKIREIRLNTDYKLSDKITVSEDFNYKYQTVLAPYNQDRSVFNRMLQLSQFTVPQYPDGTYGISSDGHNPLMYAEIGGTEKTLNDYLSGSVKGDWEIIDGLKFSTQFGARFMLSSQKTFQNSYEVYDYYDPTILRKTVGPNNLTESKSDIREITINNLLTYTNTWGDHYLSVLAGYTQISNVTKVLTATRYSFYNNDIQSLSQGANDGTKTNTGTDSQWGLRSFFGRLNYNYKEKYLFEANARYDGSSRFIGDNRYSFFPSVSVGWRISMEDFWQEFSNVVSELKLRASVGNTGNQAVALYSYYPTLSNYTYDFNGVAVAAYGQRTLANESITWETTHQTDIGVDAQFLEGRISFTADYYYKRTDGILLTLPVPGTLGLDPAPQNAGVVDNYGWEFLVGTRNSFGDFGVSGTINLNINDNNVVDLAGTGPYITSRYGTETRFITEVGYPINSYWGYRTDGYFQSDEEVASYPNIRSGIKPGDVKYLDLNDDGIINNSDMVYLGRSFPKYTFSSNQEFSYKDITLSVLWQGAAGYWARVGGALCEMGIWGSFAADYVTGNYWTPDNRDALLPRPLKSDNRNINFADRDRVNGNYLRLKNIQLSYKLPASLTKKIGIGSIRVYVSKTNLLTWSKLKMYGVDPESQVGGRTESYPQVSLTTFGINVDL
jgi:TonB-linked SusC/RagA family outer membrane protein